MSKPPNHANPSGFLGTRASESANETTGGADVDAAVAERRRVPRPGFDV